jgi:hypothetical protein
VFGKSFLARRFRLPWTSWLSLAVLAVVHTPEVVVLVAIGLAPALRAAEQVQNLRLVLPCLQIIPLRLALVVLVVLAEIKETTEAIAFFQLLLQLAVAAVAVT